MKLLKLESNSPEWFEARKKNITGSSLKSITSSKLATRSELIRTLQDSGLVFLDDLTTSELKALLTNEQKLEMVSQIPKKKAFYQLIADHLSVVGPYNEDDRARGHRLEGSAIDKFTEKTGVEVEKSPGIVISDVHPNISVSPDGLIKKNGIYIEGVEAKCLDDANTVQAYITKQVPPEYKEQILQYFIACETIEKVHLVVYSETLLAMNFAVITTNREDVIEEIDYYTNYQVALLNEVQKILEEHAF